MGNFYHFILFGLAHNSDCHGIIMHAALVLKKFRIKAGMIR